MLKQYLNDECVRMLQTAFYHENENALIYRYISQWLMNKGYTNLSKYLSDWADEEIEHGKWVKSFMESLNIPICEDKISIDKYFLDNDPITFVMLILQREDLTTEIYMKMTDRALLMDYIGSAMLLSLAQKISTEQIEETDKATTLYSQVKNLDSWGLLQLFDNSFSGK